jgi:hypothetical protein
MCVTKRPNSCSFLMESPLIANGAEISRIDGFLQKSNEKSRRLAKISIFL